MINIEAVFLTSISVDEFQEPFQVIFEFLPTSQTFTELPP